MAADIQTTISATDASFIEFLKAAVEHPFTIVSLLLIIAFIAFIGYLVWKPQQAIEFLKVIFFIKRNKNALIIKRELGKEDLINHQIFKDIEFFLGYRLDQIYSTDTFTHFDKAKLAIGHDLLVIKLTDVQKWLTCFVTNTDFEDPYLNIRSLLRHKIEKHRAYAWDEYRKIGIPKDFIEKFLEICKIHSNYLQLMLDDLLSDKIPLTVYEKVYLILGTLSQYYSTLVLEMRDVIQSINGDLKGQVYKNMIIGGNDYRCYPVPNRDYIPLVEKRLRDLCLVTKSSRSAVYVIHDFVGDDYLQGYFSKIYEYESTGYTPLMSKFQYKTASHLAEFIPEFKQHKGIFQKTNKLNELLSNLLQSNGILAVAAYPIFSQGLLRGFIDIEYTQLEVFERSSEEEVIESLKKYASILNYYTDYTKTGFNYEGNAMKEVFINEKL